MKKEYELLKMNVALTENEECRFYFDIEKKVYETMPRELKKQISAHMLIALSEFFEIEEKELMGFYLETRGSVDAEVNFHQNEKSYH